MNHTYVFFAGLFLLFCQNGMLGTQVYSQQNDQQINNSGRIIDTSFIDMGAKQYAIIRLDPRKNKFVGHWTGIEIGRNDFRNAEGDYQVPDELSFMKLKKKNSWNVNVNPVQINIGFGTDKVGLLFGLGLELSNYRLANKNTFEANEDNTFDNHPYPDSIGVSKSKLMTTYLTAPLLLEFQFPDVKRNKRVYFSVGVIAGMKLNAHTKLVYEENYITKKKKSYDTYNLNPLRYGLTARFGYRIFSGFVNYYMTPMFDAEPKIYPVYIGFRTELQRIF